MPNREDTRRYVEQMMAERISTGPATAALGVSAQLRTRRKRG